MNKLDELSAVLDSRGIEHVRANCCVFFSHMFREVCIAMADNYIEDVIRPATKKKGGLTCPALTTPPDEYADLYKGWHNDEWAEFFKAN